jgi:hypothetical protein
LFIKGLGGIRHPAVHNANTGTVGTLLQAGDIHGDITFGGRDR